MKALITKADVLRYVPHLPLPDNYDMQADILLATDAVRSRFFTTTAWDELMASRNGGTLNALQQACLHKLEPVLAYYAALQAMPVISLHNMEAPTNASNMFQFKLSRLCRYFEKVLRNWMTMNTPQWQCSENIGETQFGLFIPTT
jgi:hypothetical protein